MLEFIAFAGLLIAGFAFMAVMGFVFLIFKIALWAILFPIRLLFKLLWLPVGLAIGSVGVAAGATVLPVLLIVGVAVAVIGAIAALLALLVPAIPFVLLGLVIWAFMRERTVTA